MPLNHVLPEMTRGLEGLCEMVAAESARPLGQVDNHPLFADSADWAYNRGVYLGRVTAIAEIAKIVDQVRKADPDAIPSNSGDGRYTSESGHLTFHREVTAALIAMLSTQTYSVPWWSQDNVARSENAGIRKGMFEVASLATETMNNEMASFRLYNEGVDGFAGESRKALVAADFRLKLEALLAEVSVNLSGG